MRLYSQSCYFFYCTVLLSFKLNEFKIGFNQTLNFHALFSLFYCEIISAPIVSVGFISLQYFSFVCSRDTMAMILEVVTME